MWDKSILSHLNSHFDVMKQNPVDLCPLQLHEKVNQGGTEFPAFSSCTVLGERLEFTFFTFHAFAG